MSTSSPASLPFAGITRSHLKRLKIYYRSAGWPVRDNLEIDLIVAGLAMLLTLFLQPQLERVSDAIIRQPVVAGGFGRRHARGSVTNRPPVFCFDRTFRVHAFSREDADEPGRHRFAGTFPFR